MISDFVAIYLIVGAGLLALSFVITNNRTAIEDYRRMSGFSMGAVMLLVAIAGVVLVLIWPWQLAKSVQMYRRTGRC